MSEEELEKYKKLAEETTENILSDVDSDPYEFIKQIYQLYWHWANLEFRIEDPILPAFSPPKFIYPEKLLDSEEEEPVYVIVDYGNKFRVSKAQEMFTAGMSMYKLYNTIEKIIYLFIERLKESDGSGSNEFDVETEVQVAFEGNELAKRKAFESVINLNYNVVVTNFNPDTWGENYLQTVKRLAAKGYGYPSESPRTTYRYSGKSGPKT